MRKPIAQVEPDAAVVGVRGKRGRVRPTPRSDLAGRQRQMHGSLKRFILTGVALPQPVRREQQKVATPGVSLFAINRSD